MRRAIVIDDCNQIDGELVKQKNPDQVHTGAYHDRVGPGQYEIPNNMSDKSKGTTWSLSKVQRYAPDRNSRLPPEIGPGKYLSSTIDNTIGAPGIGA